MTIEQNKTYLLSSHKQNSEQSIGMFELFVDETIHGSKVNQKVLEKLKANDTLVVENILYLGNSLSEVIKALNEVAKYNINLCLAEENLSFKARKLSEFATSLTIASELHRKLISLNTRKALTTIKSNGKKLGHPFGAVLTKKLDDYKDEIKEMLAVGVTKASIAKKYNVCWKTVNNFVKNNPELLRGE